MMAKIRKKNSAHKCREKKFRLPLSAYISYLLIITLVLSAISLARYTVSSSDADVAKTAVFKVSATQDAGQPSSIVVDADQDTSGEYVFEVQNDSEMAVRYAVTVNNLPPDVRIDMGTQTVASSRGINSVEFDAINLDIGKIDTCMLTFTALDDAALGTYDGITVDVQFEQID